MAKAVFDPEKHYKCLLYGHCFDRELVYVELPGHFEPDTLEQFDPLTHEREFAIFVVDFPLNVEYPMHWAGTYLIPMGAIRQNPPTEIQRA